MSVADDHANGFDKTRMTIWGSNYLLAAAAIADGVTVLYAIVVAFKIAILGIAALALLCVGVGGATFLSRQVIVDAFLSRWELKLWAIALAYCLCVVGAVGWLVHYEAFGLIITWPVHQAWGRYWGLDGADMGAVVFGYVSGGVLYCCVLLALGAIHCAYWYSLQLRPHTMAVVEDAAGEATD